MHAVIYKLAFKFLLFSLSLRLTSVDLGAGLDSPSAFSSTLLRACVDRSCVV